MALTERGRRAPEHYDKQIIDRIHRETNGAGRETAGYTTVCDMLSIPRDLRPKLLGDLIGQRMVVQKGLGEVQLTERGKQWALTPLTSKDVV